MTHHQFQQHSGDDCVELDDIDWETLVTGRAVIGMKQDLGNGELFNAWHERQDQATIKGNEELFNAWHEMSRRVGALASAVQNDIEGTRSQLFAVCEHFKTEGLAVRESFRLLLVETLDYLANEAGTTWEL